AHDFNNVLAVALTGIESAASVAPDARAARFLTAAANSIGTGRRLTQRMSSLAFVALDLVPVQVDALIAGLREPLSAQLGRTSELVLDLGADRAEVETDARALGVALRHLVANAADAMPGGGTCTIATRRGGAASRAGDYVVVSVTDGGSGMDEDARLHACDLFFSTRADGLGLGLAQVKDLARRSGGFVEIDSAPRRGTTVRLGLPAR
ncbi:MAG TPA: ATP-binding protein, partial [Dokdonella sp.]